MIKIQGKLNTTQAFLRDLNGTPVKLYRSKDGGEPVAGVSGETHQYMISEGKALYLTQAEVQD